MRYKVTVQKNAEGFIFGGYHEEDGLMVVFPREDHAALNKHIGEEVEAELHLSDNERCYIAEPPAPAEEKRPPVKDNKLDKRREEYERLGLLIKARNEELGELNSDIRAAETERDRLHQEIEALNTHQAEMINTRQAELTEIQQTIGERRNELNNLNAKVGTTGQELKQLRETVSVAKRSHRRTKKRIRSSDEDFSREAAGAV